MSLQCTPFSSPKGQGPAGPRGVSACICRLSLQAAGLPSLASGVCCLVGKVYLEACAGFLVGGGGACPLGGRAISKGVFRDNCGLEKSLGSLSADLWSYVPTPLAVWPEVSQH